MDESNQIESDLTHTHTHTHTHAYTRIHIQTDRHRICMCTVVKVLQYTHRILPHIIPGPIHIPII